MTDIIHQIAKYIAAQLALLDHWDNAYALCYKNAGGLIVRYKYVDNPAPTPYNVMPVDAKGTYIYIREFDDEVGGTEFFGEQFGSCEPTGASVKKKLRAVAVSSVLCFPVELATRLSFDIQRIDLCATGVTTYDITSPHIRFIGERNGIKTLFAEETPESARPSNNIIMAALDFELSFDYSTFCNQDILPNIC